ncbi:LysR family transcriptional regulator [Listeria costaricensis]|uniref:LysR family transcriptional regulator n=1 Tax=Listeria costaricensis TaxID=2026604 RepID=UPI000C07FC82|nr:LysR family transcriptional regulator [Listeria costaricensis]
MDIQQLRYFIAAAETEHLTKAAAELSLSQSALSRSIIALEEEIGVALFDRVNRRIELNRFGKLFLEQARKTVTELDLTEQTLQNLADPESGEIKLAFLHTFGLSFIPAMLKAFQNEHPKNKLHLNECGNAELFDLIRTGAADVGISALQIEDSSLVFHPLRREKMVLIISSENPLASQTELSLPMIQAETFIHFDKQTFSRNLVEQLLANQHIHVQSSYEGLEIASVIGLVEANMGVSIVPESTCEHLNHVKVFPLADKMAERVIYLVHKAGSSRTGAVERFISFGMRYPFTQKAAE